MSTPDDATLTAQVRELVEPRADELGVEVLEVTLAGGRGRRIVRVVADRAALDADAGLDVGTIATLSRRLGAALDEYDVFPGAYTLEVTSPGVDRPLTTPRDFARNVGRDVRVQRTDGTGELEGTVLGVDQHTLRLQVGDEEQAVAFDDVDHGTVLLPW